MKETSEGKLDERYEEDSIEMKIEICNENVTDDLNYCVCHEKLVVPRYLIQYRS